MSIRVAALALLRQGPEGEELLLVRKRGTARFMLPGGKYEPGESARACLQRELDEELALPLAENASPIGCFEAQAANEAGHRVEATIYRQDHAGSPEPRPAAEIAEIAWLPLSRHEPGSCSDARPDAGPAATSAGRALALAPLVAERLLPALRNPSSRSA